MKTDRLRTDIEYKQIPQIVFSQIKFGYKHYHDCRISTFIIFGCYKSDFEYPDTNLRQISTISTHIKY
jgi:hypothetical protein